MPFLPLAASHIAGNHLSSPIGESSKLVPTLTENFCFGCALRHFHNLAFARKVPFLEPHCGHFTPFGQRSATKNSKQACGSLKYRTASRNVFGAFMPPKYTDETVSQVYYYRCSAWLDARCATTLILRIGLSHGRVQLRVACRKRDK